MEELIFNPFEDRLSRDIRNGLSSGLAKAIEAGDTTLLLHRFEHYLQTDPPKCYRDYIITRKQKYNSAITTISTLPNDPITRGVVLWNLQLFFEVHEVLEHAWYSAQEPMKVTLQALIRAAGVYIKLEYGYRASAMKIASKALPVLQNNTAILQHYFPQEDLLEALVNIQENEAPPILSVFY